MNYFEFDEYDYFEKRAFSEGYFDLYDDEEKKEPCEEETNGMQITEDESKKNSEIVENINEIQNNKTDIIIVKTETGKIPSEQKSTDNFNNISKNEILTNKVPLIKDSSSIDININEILNFNKINLKTDDGKSGDNTYNSLKRKRGRNGPGCTGGEHNKFSDDNLRRKVKHLVLKYTFDFINDKISSAYNYQNIDKGMMSKKLLTIKQDQISNATILFNKNFLNKKIGDIFSEDISTRYTNFFSDHNRNLIKYLTNEEDEHIKEYFTDLFNLKFIDCLKQFRGTDNYYCLNGITTFDDIKDEFENDKDYLNVLTKYIFEYEGIIANKKERTSYFC